MKRGYAESEVRAYLRMVAEDLAGAAERERALHERIRDLEEKARRPVLPPSEHDLITALGEETARVLGHARESAAELKAKAEEHARRVVREAQEAARELRTTTQQAVEAKTREAEDSARARAKEIVGEARSLRERVLQDLEERRQQLEQQITQLRDGRGKLVEAYELVERALAHATRVMQDERSVAPAVEIPSGAAVSSEVSAESAPSEETEVASESPSEEPAKEDEEPAPESRDVHALFERLRSEQTEEPEHEQASQDQEQSAPDAEAAASEDAGEVAADKTEAEAETEAQGGEEGDEEAESGPPPAILARDEALGDIAVDLLRRGKRALQDEQNDVLDGLRRQRGKIDVHKVLPTNDEQLGRWAHVLQPSVDKAYQAGAASVGGSVEAAPRAVLAQFASDAVTPLRDRLSASLNGVDARNPADAEIAIAQRLGARYREWRGEELETMLGDVLAASYARGAYDAAPDDARLRWVAAREGKCPDCDDNALEPTVKGGEFPTGQAFPPAHPGCRCVLVLDKD